jgi:hypothetical protein
VHGHGAWTGGPGNLTSWGVHESISEGAAASRATTCPSESFWPEPCRLQSFQVITIPSRLHSCIHSCIETLVPHDSLTSFLGSSRNFLDKRTSPLVLLRACRRAGSCASCICTGSRFVVRGAAGRRGSPRTGGWANRFQPRQAGRDRGLIREPPARSHSGNPPPLPPKKGVPSTIPLIFPGISVLKGTIPLIGRYLPLEGHLWGF